MDVLEIISDNIEAQDTHAINKLVDHYIKIGKSKWIFVEYLINLYALKYISKNIWVLKEFLKCIKAVEENRICTEHLKNLCLLLATSEYKELNLLVKRESDPERIKRILHSSTSEHIAIYDLKNILCNDVYYLMNVLYTNLLVSSTNISDSFLIVRTIMCLKKKEVLKAEHIELTDGYDVIFLVLMHFLEYIGLPEDVIKYVRFCKDLFYYRCKQKSKVNRANLIFYCIFVLMQRRVKDQCIDYMSTSKKKVEGTDYLFIWMPFDKELCFEIESERESKKHSKQPEKIIYIEDYRFEKVAVKKGSTISI